MWKCHVVYESRPHSVIVSMGGHLYRIPEVVLTTVPPKKCHKVVSHTTKFSFFTICSKGEQKNTTTTTSLPQAPYIQQKQVDKATEKCNYSFFTPSSHVSRLVEQPQPQQVRDRLPQTKQRDVSSTTSSKCFSLSSGTQCNGDHFFLRRENLSKWISVASYLFRLAQNSFLAILVIYFF
jgi:hypothetical protein